jgi:adenosine deaminase
MASHPVGGFIADGLVVTVNTDDPKMFHNTLADEYRALAVHFALDQAALCRLIDTAVRVSWLSGEAKHDLQHALHAHPAWVATHRSHYHPESR